MTDDDIFDGPSGVGTAHLSAEHEKAERRRVKKIEDALETGSLEPFQRYRVLVDVPDHYQDLAEMADRKSRFALVILGAVNALNLLVVARPQMLTNAGPQPALLGVYVAIYVAVSLYLFVQAISALKPRIATVLSPVDSPRDASRPILGLRFVRNILDVGFEEYYQRWKQAQFVDVNRELALHVRQLAAIVTAK